jgi:hypothetical protein
MNRELFLRMTSGSRCYCRAWGKALTRYVLLRDSKKSMELRYLTEARVQNGVTEFLINDDSSLNEGRCTEQPAEVQMTSLIQFPRADYKWKRQIFLYYMHRQVTMKDDLIRSVLYLSVLKV